MTPKEKLKLDKIKRRIKEAKLSLVALRKKRLFYRWDKRLLRWLKSLFSK